MCSEQPSEACAPHYGEGGIKNMKDCFLEDLIFFILKKPVKWLSWEEEVRILFGFFFVVVYCSVFWGFFCSFFSLNSYLGWQQ